MHYLRGGGWDVWENIVVAPELGSTTCRTPVIEVSPRAVGEVQIEEVYALFRPF